MVAPVEEVPAPDTVVSQVDDTQVQVGMDPHWSEVVRESYRRNEARLSGVDP